jgi:hypothetical protein
MFIAGVIPIFRNKKGLRELSVLSMSCVCEDGAKNAGLRPNWRGYGDEADSI